MRIREYQLEELTRARELQDELAKLHVPSPVLSWNYKIKDKNKEIIEIGKGKANSYTRNGLNSLAWNVGLASPEILNVNGADGLINTTVLSGGKYNDAVRGSNAAPLIMLGTIGNEESLDTYNIVDGFLISTLTTTIFNTATRKLVTTIVGTYTATNDISLKEVGVVVQRSSSTSNRYLAVYDTFEPINLIAGNTITWTYTTEVSYPNP